MSFDGCRFRFWETSLPELRKASVVLGEIMDKVDDENEAMVIAELHSVSDSDVDRMVPSPQVRGSASGLNCNGSTSNNETDKANIDISHTSNIS